MDGGSQPQGKLATYLNQVDLVKRLITPRLLNIKYADNVLMVKIAQKLHFSESSQAKHGVVEGGDFLDGDLLTRRLVYRRAGALLSVSDYSQACRIQGSQVLRNLPDHTVGALAHNILDVILLAHVERDLAGSRRVGRLRSRHDVSLCRNSTLLAASASGSIND